MVRNNMTLIRCPCRKCGLRQWIDPDSGQLEEHLLRRGFMLGFNEEPAANVGHEEEADIGREDEESPEHGVHHEEGEADEGDDDAGGDGGGDAERKQTPLTSALRDPHVQELLLKDTGNAKPEAKLAQMEVDGMTPLYPGCRPEDTRLSVTLECLEMKAEHKWTDSSFSDNMKSWHARLPKDNTLPTSIDEAKKVVCPLDLPHVKYHACINDCALFRNEYKDRTTCPVCGQGRYKRGNKKVPLKVVWYFPITPRLQRYFVDPKEAKLMQWHAEREKPADDPEKGKILTHPADASQWNALDIEFADEFGSEPRNIRLGMSTDGLNPFGNQSSTHSTWPVFVWPYNLPPGCAQSSVQDYPGYAYVSCQVNHGFKGCVKCMDKTPHLQLPKPPGSCKTVFQGTRMWLRFDHPWRKRKDLFNGEEELGRAPRPRSGEEISELLENWEECPAPGKKRPRESPLLGVWKARSVFWDLPYWKVLHTPHSLDVMHITKNVTESLLGTLMNMPERTKDGPKARTDLKLLGLKKELQYPTDSDDDDEQTETTQGHHKRAKKNEVVVLKPACFTLSEEELERFFECLLGVKVPHGYSGKISRYLDVAKKRFSGMKSHDCHVLMTQILPVAMRGIMDDHVRETLFGLCNFFDVISRKSIGVKQLNRLQEEIVEILCELEIYFPPAFFDIMVHLLVHVVDDIIHLGPTFLHNMMPFERLNGVIKGFVRNRARPDGSIAKGFLTYECISFCQNYLSTENEDVESLPQPPPAEPKGKAAAPLSPIPSPNEDDIDDDGPVDVDAYLNTGADIDDLYMAGADEEAYRARDEPAGPPKATKQRLVFRGFSQETPPAADTQEPTAANIFSPNTLIKKVNEQFEASGAVAPKKPRKRPSKNKEKSASQPPPTIRHRDSMVPPSKDGLTRMHEAGKPILGPELQHLASGAMLPLQDSILVLESILLKDKDPNYPVFTVKVPRDVGFVTDAPADIFFIAYEDIFKLFHARRLDYNLVRLFALNLAMKIKRESTPDVAIADPYYMRESQLNLSAVRVRASLYLQKCFLDNKRKDNILLAYFPEDTHCVLISIAPKFSLATYFDSGSAKKKNYARIRGVLDDALEGYFKKGGAFKEKAECFRDDGKHKFKHVFEFPCVKQPENSTLDAFYVMHHLKGFVRDSQNLRLPSALRGWAEKLARINDDDLREDFQDTRVKLSHIITQDVTTGGGPLHQGRALCKRDIEHRLKAQGDTRTWITKDLYKPFPEPCEP
ncbi:hypothetical protein QYE76_010006 [Lolium multiflorum]|uniref:DUF4218 domain-containing protein n=1 Tax=Lolium multiflorum TaxID=4521 RepID=A0AAD8TWD7_LOLMU|nr:hypothetical protein QYE76_010006 [Lolium multiflorum]